MRVLADIHVRRDLGDTDHGFVVRARHVELLQRRAFDRRRLNRRGLRDGCALRHFIEMETTMRKIGCISAILLSSAISAAIADSTTSAQSAAPEARIPFANHGGIYNWQVVDDRTVLIQGLNRKWYKASLFSSCIDLPFAQRLGFESNSDGSFDKFSSIKVRGQHCPLVSLVETAPPPKKKKAHKPAATSVAPAAPAAPTAPAAPAAPAQ